MKAIKRFGKKHKMKIIVGFSLTLLAVGGFLFWFLRYRKLNREQIKKRLNFVSSSAAPPPLMSSTQPKGSDEWRTPDQFLPTVRNQGNCGSCTTFSMAGTLAISFNYQNKMKNPVSLSPQMLLACRTKKRVEVHKNNQFWKRPCDGFYTIRHAQYLRDGYTRDLGATAPGNARDYAAMPLYDDLPYLIGGIDKNLPKCRIQSNGIGYNDSGNPTSGCGGVLEKFENICSDDGPLGKKSWVGFRVTEIIRISQKGDAGRIEAIKDALRKYGAVAMSIYVYDNFATEAQSSPYKYDPSRGKELDGGHAMVCVGWRCGHWLVRNSWGRGWGCSTSGSFSALGNGYCYIRFGGFKGDCFAVRAERVMMPTGDAMPPSPQEIDSSAVIPAPTPVDCAEDDVYVPPPPPPPPPKSGKRSGGFCVIL